MRRFLSLLSDLVRSIADWYLLKPYSRERDSMSQLPKFALAPLPGGMFALVMSHEEWGAGWYLVVPQLVSEVTNQSAIDTLVHLEPVGADVELDASAVDALVAQFRAQLDNLPEGGDDA